MFICNFKLNKNLLYKLIFFILFTFITIIIGLSIYKILNSNSSSCELPNQEVIELTPENYTNTLRAVHDDLDTYLNQTISFSGYVYKIYDFTDNQFVLARDMIIGNNNETLVVGFLCETKDALTFPEKTWVKIIGTIVKGDYHGEIPKIEIKKIEGCTKPENDLVPPPSDTYIQTGTLF